MKIYAQNYTQFPNAILDAIASFTEAELRVVMLMARQTFGWHREAAQMSISFIQRATGLSNRAVIDACESLAARGLIEKFRGKGMRGANAFRFIVHDQPPEQAGAAPTYEPSSQAEIASHEPSSQVGAATCEPSSQVPVNPVHANKETGTKRSKKSSEPSLGSLPHRFVSLWCRDYVAQFGLAYVPQPGDHAHAKRLLAATKFSPESLVRIARSAWQRSGPKHWACANRSRTVGGFCSKFNEIQAELAAPKPVAAFTELAGPVDFK